MRHQTDSFPRRTARARSMMRAVVLSAGILSAGLFGTTAQAASMDANMSAAPATIDMPAPVAATIAKLTGGKVKVLHAFNAPAGLIGVAFTQGPGQNGIVYVSPDGAYVFQGRIIGSDGSNITDQEAAKYLPQPPSAAENFAVLDKTHSFLWGKSTAKKELWIVFDPNCIYCHKTFNSLKKYVDDGTLKVHIVMAGFLKQSSLGKAAAILSAKDPVAALTEDETKFDVSAEEGGIKPDTSDAQAVKLVKANNAWMQEQQIGGTPYLLFRNAEGKPEAIGGYAENVPALLAKIGSSNG